MEHQNKQRRVIIERTLHGLFLMSSFLPFESLSFLKFEITDCHNSPDFLIFMYLLCTISLVASKLCSGDRRLVNGYKYVDQHYSVELVFFY